MFRKCKGRMLQLRNAVYKKVMKMIGSEKFVYSSNPKNVDYPNSIYAAHPFTNWSLNPHHQSQGNRQHTIEGFRKTSNSNSVKEYFQNTDYQTKKIFCMGGCSTYCAFLSEYQMSWPYKLQEKNNNMSSEKVVVANGGVGGWGTLQSLIRFSAWGPILKPELTIVYQSKNDLTPFYNGRGTEKELFPLYENIMLQFAAKLPSNKFLKKLYLKSINNNLNDLYTDQILAHPKGLERFSSECLDLTYSRYGMMADLAHTWQGKVFFIPEIMEKSSFYYDYMQLLHQKMQEVAQERDWCDYFDIIDIFPHQSNFFFDKMHFSEEGCEVFSDLLIQTILRTDQST